MNSFSWRTHEYVHRKRSQDWFWVVGIVATAVAITSILFGNVLFAVVVVIGAFVLCMFAARTPKIIDVEIDEKTVRVENVVYPFKELKSFWIDSEHFDGTRLVLERKRTFMPHVMIPMEEDHVETVKAILSEKIPLIPFEEHAVQSFLEHIGF